MGHSSQAGTLLSTLQSKYAPGWAYPWYDAEAGWFVMAATGTSP